MHKILHKEGTVFIVLLVLLSFKTVSSQNILTATNSEAWGVGGASVMSKDVFGVFNNPSAYSEIKKLQCGIYSEQRMSQTKLGSVALSLVIPTTFMNIGFAVSHLADTFINQEKVNASLSKKISKNFSIGATVSYLVTYSAGQPFSGNIIYEFGGIYDINNRFQFGVFIFNPTQRNYSDFSNDKIPTYYRIGGGYDVLDRLRFVFEMQQLFNQQILFRGGIRYNTNGLLTLSAGLANNPVYITFGIGIRLKKFKLDYAASFHEVLGYSPHLGIIFPQVN